MIPITSTSGGRESLFHFRHRWIAQAAHPFTYSDISFGRDLATYEPKTRILYRCDVCGKHKTREIDGTWTLVEAA